MAFPRRCLRLDRVLPVSAGVDANPLFLLLPKNLARPLGVLVTSIIDTETLPAECSRDAIQADGIVGSAILRDHMTLLLDICRLAELGDPAGSRLRRRRLPAEERNAFWRSTTPSSSASWYAGTWRSKVTTWSRRPTGPRHSANWMPARSTWWFLILKCR